ncbi:MAG: alpha/beta hydrolase [Acutalibacteraceae bacterium]|nr:alpha/beta hydrolase [Acutalibacteraceae bacterium]
MEKIELWENVPGNTDNPVLEYYPSTRKTSNTAVVIFPGGGYSGRAIYEGKGYAEYLNTLGITAFVCQYRVAPNRYPLPLLDARRAVQYVRANAEKYEIDPDKIGVMGSSAGGHLAATLSTVFDDLRNEIPSPDEIDNVDFMPNFQILCYPVIKLKDYGHIGSGNNLLGEKMNDSKCVDSLCADERVNEKTPKAFIWHTFDDAGVNVKNSLIYATALKDNGVSCEMHIFPNGAHGLGLAQSDDSVGQWPLLLKNWLKHFNLLK